MREVLLEAVGQACNKKMTLEIILWGNRREKQGLKFLSG